MRVVEMDPSEKAPRPDPIQPRKRFVGHFVAGAIDAAERQRLVFRQVEIVEVGLESLRYAPFVIEHVRADEAARRVAARLQPLGDRRLLVVEEEAAVVADAVRGGILSGEDRRVGRQRERRRRDGLLEEHALAREAIEVRRLDPGEPVRVDAVGACRVERDEQQVEIAGGDARRQMAERLAVDRRDRARYRRLPPRTS